MGLEFQSRGFLRACPPDHFPADRTTGWVVTGRSRNFFHYCQAAKWSSFDAAREVFKQASSLRNSMGFFSLQEDWLDCSDRSRAYVLDCGRFLEVNTHNIESKEDTPLGLFQHFEWCRHCFWPHLDDGFPLPSVALDAIFSADEPVDLAGWFFLDKQDPEFPAVMQLFANPEIAVTSRCSVSGGDYLFVGEESVCLNDVVRPLLEASQRFPLGKGLLFLLGESSVPQIAIAEGQAQVLASMELDELAYHDAVAFDTGRFGYEKR
jgi:hypothetical protein